MIGSFIYHLRNIDNQQKGDLLIDYSNVAVIFEEVELYFHPEYQKSYLNYLLKQLERAHIKKLRNLNIILVTHSPFVLSDVVSENILCLKNGLQEKMFRLRRLAQIFMICLNEYYRVFNSDEIKSRRIKLLEQELERLKHGSV